MAFLINFKFMVQNYRKNLLSVAVVGLLSACSGGGGGSSSTAAPPPTPAPPPVTPPPVTPPPVTTPPDIIVQAVPIPENSTEEFLLSSGSRGLLAPSDTSPMGSTVLSCATNIRARQGCDFNTLPLIGMETANPSIDDIMNRVVTSHDWMRVRFREILEQMPPEVLLMTRGLTAIVISYDIRPSFYYPYSGAIYLDPNGMWLTEEEKAVIDETPDFRSEFGSQLQFIILWRYVQDNTDIRSFNRDLALVSLKTASLLFHELAHANDFFSPSRVDFIDRTVAPINAIESIESDGLIGTFPLLSSTMRSLARVSFRGETATEAQSALTSEDIAVEFPGDRANDYYNFNTRFEDLAMAFEEAMMYHSYGISRDVAVTNFPESNFCEQYLVSWGQRNRIGDPAVQVRSMYTVRALLPEIADDVQNSLDNMPAPTQMEVGLNWCENIVLSPLNARGLVRDDISNVRTVESLMPYE